MRPDDETQPTDANSTITAVTDSPGANRSRPLALTRRGMLMWGGGLVVGGALTGGGFGVADAVASARGSSSSGAAAGAGAAKPAIRRYHSTMVTTPVTASWTKAGASPSPGLIFATPQTTNFNGVIMDSAGEPVWIEPEGLNVTDLRMQSYRGENVLTYWRGSSIDGHGVGVGTILDSSYRTIATVHAGRGMQSDLHEFNLTTRNTALVTAYPTVAADLTSLGGPRNGWMLACHFQEIDVATGSVLLDWKSADHLSLAESYESLAGTGSSYDNPYDPYHFNAVADDGENVLLSSRHAHTIYSIALATGDIRWRLGGKRSDFDVAPDATFAWQHHVRRLPDGRISMFDNQYKAAPGHSSGLILNADETTRKATLSARYAYDGHLGTAEGSVQVLDDGHVLVGWGDSPVATEFTSSGEAIYEARKLGSASYRVFRYDWTGAPTTDPDLAVESAGGGLTAYASWNGATEVASWRFLSGASASALTTASVVNRTGFETTAPVPSGAVIGVEALNAAGAVIGKTHRLVA